MIQVSTNYSMTGRSPWAKPLKQFLCQTAKCHLMQIRPWRMKCRNANFIGNNRLILNGSYQNVSCSYIYLVHLKISPSPMVQVLQCIMILLLLYITCQRFQLYSIAIHGGQISIYCTYRSLTWRIAALDKTQACSKPTPHDNDTDVKVKNRFRSYWVLAGNW